MLIDLNFFSGEKCDPWDSCSDLSFLFRLNEYQNWDTIKQYNKLKGNKNTRPNKAFFQFDGKNYFFNFSMQN